MFDIYSILLAKFSVQSKKSCILPEITLQYRIYESERTILLKTDSILIFWLSWLTCIGVMIASKSVFLDISYFSSCSNINSKIVWFFLSCATSIRFLTIHKFVSDIFLSLLRGTACVVVKIYDKWIRWQWRCEMINQK